MAACASFAAFVPDAPFVRLIGADFALATAVDGAVASGRVVVLAGLAVPMGAARAEAGRRPRVSGAFGGRSRAGGSAGFSFGLKKRAHRATVRLGACEGISFHRLGVYHGCVQPTAG